MASTYTSNIGVEKIGSGEQAGTWGTTTNTNFDIIDQAVNGVVRLNIAGQTSFTVTTTDGILSNGGNKVLHFHGALGGDCTVLISPNDQKKVFVIYNNTTDAGSGGPYNVVIRQQTQGSPSASNDVIVPNGSFKLVFCDGGLESGSGATAKVNDITGTLDLATLKIGGVTVTTTGAELNKLSGGTSATSTTIADADRLIVNDDGTIVQVAATDLRNYFNAQSYETKTTLTSTGNVAASGARSVYQRVDTTSGNITVTLAVTNLLIGQYIIVDKIAGTNTMTMAYPANNQGITLGASAELVIAIFNGTSFSFVETIKS